MYEEYVKQWKHYQKQFGDQTCLFLMVGRFYELYDVVDPVTGEGQTNVKQAVETLGITLTVRKGDGPKKEDCYFAGFPEPSLQKFAAMLTREGWTVVVCDQQKNEKGAVTGRPVSRVFSPGTHIETAGAEAPYLAGLWIQETLQEPPSFSAVVLDMTTGHLVSYEGRAAGSQEIWSADSLVHFFQVHMPRETVVWWRGAAFAKPSETVLRRRTGLHKGTIHIDLANEDQQGTFENAYVRKSFLEQVFSDKLCLLPIYPQLQIQQKSLTERALVSLLSFAEQHFPSAIQNLHEHQVWCPEDSLYMGNNSLYQLNYITQGQEQSILSLFGKAQTSLGKRGLRERLLFPSSNPAVIQKRLKEVEFAFTLDKDRLKKAEAALRFIHDIARLHRKIVMYSVTASDILALDTSYGCIQTLQGVFEGTCLELEESLYKEFKLYKKRFLEHFDIEKAKLALQKEDISFLPATKAPKTKACEDKLQEIQQVAKDGMETLRQWVNLPEEALRLEVSDSLSYFYSATKTTLTFVKQKCDATPVNQHPFPGITVHNKKTGRGSIEFPQLETLHFQTFTARSKFQQAVKEELPPICQSIEDRIWSSIESYVAFVDVTLTLAKVAKERGYTKPVIQETDGPSGFEAKDLRHPLLESIQTRTEYVKHSVSLGLGDTDDSGLLLYGMNASGKSSLMKAIGICILLAQAGSFVPASSCTLKPFKSILTRILNQDNIWAGLSSFAVEVSELRDIFQRASQTSLVLGDELCSGTESVSATSLVAAGIQYLHKTKARFVFATHYHDLLSLPSITSLENLGIWHLRVHYDAATDTLIYDRTLHKGPGGTLYGLEVAKAMHLPFEILQQAHQFRKQLLGETSQEEAPNSSWNSNLVRKECEVCKHPIVRDLEVHHIKQRADAENKQFADGSKMNDLRNLIVVCQGCHDKHHAGEIEIGVEKQTSKGPQRDVTTTPPKAAKEKVSKWSVQERSTIEQYLKQFKHLPLARIAYDLEQQEHILISVASLRKIREGLA
jgi:DNA mismatch repair protein MutS